MRVALLSNVTTDLLAGVLREHADVWVPAGFNVWQQELLDEASTLHSCAPDAVFVLLHAGAEADAWEDAGCGRALVEGWLGAVEAYARGVPGVPVFVSSLDVGDGACRLCAEDHLSAEVEGQLDKGVRAMHDSGLRTYVLPVRDVVARVGRDAFYSPKTWYAGAMPYSMRGLRELASLIGSRLRAVVGQGRKCLAVDLDGTLWGGVVSEDGAEGIVLGRSGEGALYLDVQRLLRRMRERGVLLAIISNNSAADVDAAFAHPHMLLGHDDFAAELLGWSPKPERMRRLAKELNIGLDAVVFLDDDSAERARMRAECPEVAVADFPRDLARLPQAVADLWERHFLSLELTGEDARRARMYREESGRRLALASAKTVDDYLRGLGMRMGVLPMREADVLRVAQLVGRANQLNVTTIRHSEGELRALSDAGDSDVLVVRMADAYGDQGICGVVVLAYEWTCALVVTFLMSCRVMGRRAEVEAMARVGELLGSRGAEEVFATYVRTEKNRPAADLWDRLGFTLVGATGEGVGECRRYRADLSDLPRGTGLFGRIGDEGGAP